MFAERVSAAKRAKNTTFSDLLQDQTINLSVPVLKMDVFCVCVHKITRFRARKGENSFRR